MSEIEHDIDLFEEWQDKELPEAIQGAILFRNDELLQNIALNAWNATPERLVGLIRSTFLLGWYKKETEGEFINGLKEELEGGRTRKTEGESSVSPSLFQI